MSRWFRHYAGMMRDDKLVRVAIRSKQSIERVAWIWGAILESAAEIDDGGRYDLDAAEIAYFLRADEVDIDAVLVALAEAGRVADGTVVKWGNRQFSSDRSKERVAAHRERKRAERDRGNSEPETGNGDVTLQACHGNAPETETELEKESPPKPPRKRRGEGKTKLPEDWVAPPVSELTPKARECAEQWTRESYETVAEGFVCYWRRSGKTTEDWRLTWCGWIIREHSKVMRDQKFGNAPPAKPVNRPLTADELKNAIRFNEDQGNHAKAAEYRELLAGMTERSRGPPGQSLGNVVGKVMRQAGAG